MSAPMKKHHTNPAGQTQAMIYIVDNAVFYAIPRSIAKKYIVETKNAVSRIDNVNADDLFADHDKKYGKPAALLKGLRAREDLSQVEFAKHINVSQSNLSKMESGERPIGKTIAKRIEKAFSVNYRYFLDLE